MRRIGNVWPEVVSFDNLCAAAHRAARGKRTVRSTARFLDRLEPEVLQLQRELVAGSYRPGAAVTFFVHDPKRREITAAPFRDRVVHHALIDPLEPHFDRRMIANSLACRRGKGQHAALRQARKLVRRHDWFLKLDVRQFFPSLAHEVVLATLRRLIKDRRVLELCKVIVRAGGTAGRGLPIGHLTSQWFANLVLDRLDHWACEQLRIEGYLRYMDDFVLFAAGKPRLRTAHAAVSEQLAELGLALKDTATVLAPARQGLPFLGFAIHRGTTRLRPDNLRRIRTRLRRRRKQFEQGQFDQQRLADCTRSVIAHLTHGNTLAWRRAYFADNETAADRRLRQPRQPRRQLQQPRDQRAVGQPQQQRTDDPQQQPRAASRQDVPLPDPGRRHPLGQAPPRPPTPFPPFRTFLDMFADSKKRRF